MFNDRGGIGFILFILKAFTALWSLILLAVSAATIAQWNNLLGFYYARSGFSQANAVLATAVLTFVWFCIAIFFRIFRPDSRVISVLVETCVLGFLWILCLGSVASLSAVNDVFSGSICIQNSVCSLVKGSTGLGWILWFLITAILLIELIITFRNHGTSMSIWMTPFHELLSGGTTARRTPKQSGVGVEHKAERGQNGQNMSSVPQFGGVNSGVGGQAGGTISNAHDTGDSTLSPPAGGIQGQPGQGMGPTIPVKDGIAQNGYAQNALNQPHLGPGHAQAQTPLTSAPTGEATAMPHGGQIVPQQTQPMGNDGSMATATPHAGAPQSHLQTDIPSYNAQNPTSMASQATPTSTTVEPQNVREPFHPLPTIPKVSEP